MSPAKAYPATWARFVWTAALTIIFSFATSGVVLLRGLAQTPGNAPPGVSGPQQPSAPAATGLPQQPSSPAATGSPQQPSSPAATAQDARPGFGLSLLQGLIIACVGAGVAVLLA